MGARVNHKRSAQTQARRLKVKLRGKICAPERYKACVNRTIEKAGLTAKYYTIHGQTV